MNICFKTGNGSDFTPVSNVFIDEYIKGANPAFVTVYIIALRYFYALEDIDTKILSEITGLLESDIINALEYWDEKGVIVLEKSEDKLITIDFVNLMEKALMKEAEKQAAIKVENELSIKNKNTVPQAQAKYTKEEMGYILEKNPEIKFIFSQAERAFGKLLTETDRNALVSAHEWLKLPVEVIAILITYCSENNKGLHYLEKVAIDWYEKGINTEEKATEYISLFNNEYRDIMQAFGINSREPIESEQNYMKKWVKVFKMPKEIIKEACERTIVSTGKPQFSYADSILKSWFEKNVQSMEDIKRIDEEFNKEKKKRLEESSNSSVKKETGHKSRFVNFEQRNSSPERLRELERKLLENDIKKWEVTDE